MPAPVSVDEFLDMTAKSGLVDPERLESCRRALAERNGQATPKDVADALVEQGLLTGFQAENLLLGRWRGFLISGKYRLLARLGSGGMGCVYLCEHLFMGRRVALKVLPIAHADDPDSVQRFYHEARAIARLDHPNIVRAHDIDREGKLHFLVMEYVDGCNLHDLIQRRGPLAPGRAANYIRQAAQGLQHAHEAGLVHRDIKPGNLIVDRAGTVKLLDLGLARFFDEARDFLPHPETGSTLGTADYLAPEQILDSVVDIRADIYSLGGSFYYLLAGKSPFEEGTVPQKLIWHQVRRPRPIRALRSDLPEELGAIIERMLNKEPANRYQTPAEVVQALAAWGAEQVPPSPEELPPPLPCPPGAGLPGAQTPLSRETLSPLGSRAGARNSSMQPAPSQTPRVAGSKDPSTR